MKTFLKTLALATVAFFATAGLRAQYNVTRTNTFSVTTDLAIPSGKTLTIAGTITGSGPIGTTGTISAGTLSATTLSVSTLSVSTMTASIASIATASIAATTITTATLSTASISTLSTSGAVRLAGTNSISGTTSLGGTISFSGATTVPAVAKAWGVIKGSDGSLLASYGVASSGRSATGIYQVTFSAPFGSASYSPMMTAEFTALANVRVTNATANAASFSMTVSASNSAAIDPTTVFFQVFGN